MNIETANRLFELRKKSGISQEALAEKIGVSRQAISKWERAEASPDTDNLVLLAKLYDVSLDELLLGEKREDKSEENTKSAEETNESAETEKEPEQGENKSEEKKKEPKFWFDDGIHVRDGDSSVDVGFRGVYVEDKDGTKVSVGKNGVFVRDGKGEKNYTCDEFCKCEDKPKNFWYIFPFPMIVVSAFLFLGFVFSLWHIAWLVFLTIPLYYSFIDAVIKKKVSHFAFPVLVVAAYLFIGMVYRIWHPTWIMFLSIPFYYWIAELIKS